MDAEAFVFQIGGNEYSWIKFVGLVGLPAALPLLPEVVIGHLREIYVSYAIVVFVLALLAAKLLPNWRLGGYREQLGGSKKDVSDERLGSRFFALPRCCRENGLASIGVFSTLQPLATSLVWPTLRIQYLDLACSCFRCNDTGGTYVFTSEACTGVALYAPETIRGHLFCATRRSTFDRLG